jgi:hypothetical protein
MTWSRLDLGSLMVLAEGRRTHDAPSSKEALGEVKLRDCKLFSTTKIIP